ncbi:hypothetical protein [Burkholderia metallica]|uniref:hypothetical protein n=1 Tax=Burkholderia metallica TaxID=488729 RepID=UPI001CF3F89B|nr:hypothetical protein [Burkholderia metallica]MCA8003342.1 hypothetical protein [Burkholderia metallica]
MLAELLERLAQEFNRTIGHTACAQRRQKSEFFITSALMEVVEQLDVGRHVSRPSCVEQVLVAAFERSRICDLNGPGNGVPREIGKTSQKLLDFIDYYFGDRPPTLGSARATYTGKVHENQGNPYGSDRAPRMECYS